jgi:hypothetical protein
VLPALIPAFFQHSDGGQSIACTAHGSSRRRSNYQHSASFVVGRGSYPCPTRLSMR